MKGPDKAFDPFEHAFLNAYPNPERIGCPGDEVLRGLATKKLAISHPARKHIAHCSPCWREFRSFEREIKRCRKLIKFSGIAALFLCVLLGAYMFWSSQKRAEQDNPVLLTLDLRAGDKNRGADDTPHPAWHLPSKVVKLSITLPWGSDEGVYDVQVRTGGDTVLASTLGKAEIADGSTDLNINRLDLRRLTGKYILAFSHDGRHFKADIAVY